MDSFIRKGFYTIGALKTNRIIYPCVIRQKVSEFALYLRKTDQDVSLVTVGSREFYVYRYEGGLNEIPNVVVIISYPKAAFGDPKALGVFISTNVGISTQEILDTYIKRWQSKYFSARVKIHGNQSSKTSQIHEGSSRHPNIIFEIARLDVDLS